MFPENETKAGREPSRITRFAHEITEAAEHAAKLEEMTRLAVAELLGEEPTLKDASPETPCRPGVLGIYEDRLRNIRDSLNVITYHIHRMNQ
jgi:hypothetical protein